MTRDRTESPAGAPATRPSAARPRRRGRDPRSLPLYGVYRRFRNLAFGAPAAGDDEALARLLFRALVEEIPTSSPILGVRLYQRDGNDFVLLDMGGEAGDVAPGYRVPADHPVVAQARRDGWALVRRGDGRFDEWLERAAGEHAIAKLVLGPDRDLLLSFTLREPIATAEVLNALTALGSLADAALERLQFRHLLEQARAVQTSLLPRQLPVIPGFELTVRMRPAEVVGGDIYDVMAVGPDAFGICIADATGHGLPAALQARDVIIGLRMGMEQQLRMVATVEKLSRVLAGSSSRGRYVSLFFGEIDRDGHLIYINAGHPPPLVLGTRRKRAERLGTSGPILGLAARHARPWMRNFERLEAGDLLALYTDGLLEVRRDGDDGEEFGLERLAGVLRRQADRPLEEIADRLFAEVDAFGGGAPALDDQTLLLVRRS